MTISEVMSAAIRDFEEHGFDSDERLRFWETKIREAMADSLKSAADLDRQFKAHMKAIFDRLIQNGKVLQSHPGVSRFTLARIAPRLHDELTRRIMVGVNLIKLNKEEATAGTLKRFSGWASSVPAGGSENVDKKKVKEDISKSLSSLPYVQRRLLTDQGHKLNASISAVVAIDAGAIAARWLSHFRQPGYDYRVDHKERDGLVYLMRDTWATKQGFVKVGAAGWSDEITQPAEEVYCRCRWTYLYHLRQLPDDMLTVKGRAALKEAQSA